MLRGGKWCRFWAISITAWSLIKLDVGFIFDDFCVLISLW